MTEAAIRDPRADDRTPGVRVWRGERIESLHEVHAAVADPEGRVRSAHGDHGRGTWIRSSAKPIQVLPLVEEGLVDRFGSLSGREREIFQLIAEAKTNKEIAALLNVSSSTVETHRAHIMEKLDLHSAAEIVLYAVRRGVIR